MILLLQSLKLLSVMAAIRLDAKPDKIEDSLFCSLMDSDVALPSSQDRSIRAPSDPLASSTWEEVLFSGYWECLSIMFLSPNRFLIEEQL